MDKLLSGWDFSRILRTAVGLGVLLVGLFSKIWFFAFFGAFLTLMAILKMGCAGSCSLPQGEEGNCSSKND